MPFFLKKKKKVQLLKIKKPLPPQKNGSLNFQKIVVYIFKAEQNAEFLVK